MRLLIDENISPRVGTALRAAGHDVIAATDVCRGSPDRRIVAIAISEVRYIITEDKDFGELAFRDRFYPPGLIRLVLHGYTPAEKAERLLGVLATESASVGGAVVVVEPLRTRTRSFA